MIVSASSMDSLQCTTSMAKPSCLRQLGIPQHVPAVTLAGGPLCTLEAAPMPVSVQQATLAAVQQHMQSGGSGQGVANVAAQASAAALAAAQQVGAYGMVLNVLNV